MPRLLIAVALVLVSSGPHARASAPVLLLRDATHAGNPLGTYYGEILRGEGLLAFDERDRSTWSGAVDRSRFLSSYQTIILSEMNLDAAEQALLRDYVQKGGVLISARPGAGLSDVFGVQPAGSRTEQNLQYFGVDDAATPGRGITQGALQYHGVATNYNFQGASALAYLYDNAQTPSIYPAVTSNSYGQGRAIALAFDPAKSVVLSRQGNPDWQNTEGDDIPGYRPHDMFTRTDGATYYDLNRLAVPHADELQRFIANIVIEESSLPLPRMWYLPGTHKSIMVNTGDGEDNFGTHFNQVLNDAASYGGKFSVYLRDIGVANTTVAQEAAWRAAGHEVGVHMYGDGAEGAGAEDALSQTYGRVAGALLNKFGHPARTSRNHTIDWTGWVDMARIESGYGTQLDTNYYHYLNSSQLNPLTSNGYFTGSGLPQRFIDDDGQLLTIYQAATQWPDEWFADAGLSAAQTVNIIKGMFEATEEHGYYSAFVNNIHPVRYNGSDITSVWAQAIWEYCEQEGIPMWSAEMLLDFTRARNASEFLNITYAEGQLEFDYVAGAAADFDLTTMIPAIWNGKPLEAIEVDGVAVDWIVEEIKGIQYAMFAAPSTEARVLASYFNPALDGDYNEDGRVDAADFVVWRDSLGSTDELAADGSGNGVIDAEDYNVWKNNFGTGATSQILKSIPEPSSLAMFAIGCLTLSVCRRL